MKNQENQLQNNGDRNKICSLLSVPERELEAHIAPGREALIRYNEKKGNPDDFALSLSRVPGNVARR